MLKKSLLLAAIAAGSITGLAQAQTAIVRVGPPSPVYEAVPAARPGYVWAPGHQEWRGGQYVWVAGHWVEERPGFAYVPPRWVQRSDGTWTMVGERWERGPYGDRDHDGVPNRYDNADDRQYSYSYRVDDPYGDRDGDGVPNYRDRHPDNRHNW